MTIQTLKLSDKEELLHGLDCEIKLIQNNFNNTYTIYNGHFKLSDDESPTLTFFMKDQKGKTIKKLYDDLSERKQDAEIQMKFTNKVVLKGFISAFSGEEENDPKDRFVIYMDKEQYDNNSKKLDHIQNAPVKALEINIDLSFILKAVKNYIKKAEHKPHLISKLENFKKYDSQPHQDILKPLKNLLESQQNAVRYSLINPVSVIWGPAGAGKTTTLIEIVRNLYYGRKKILITSYTHTAIDNLLYGFYDKQKNNWLIPKEDILRIGQPRIADKEARDKINEVTTYGHLMIIINKLDIKIQKYRQCYVYLLRQEIDKKRNRIMELRENISQINGTISECKSIKNELTSLQSESFLSRLKNRRRITDLQTRLHNCKMLEEERHIKKEQLQKEEAELSTLEKKSEKYVDSYDFPKIPEMLDGKAHDIKSVSKKIKELIEEKNKLKAQTKELEKDLIARCSIVGITLASLLIRLDTDDEFPDFDYLIIDEVSMVPPPLIAGALYHNFNSIVLSGDPMQLPPIPAKKEKSHDFFTNSLYDILNFNDPYDERALFLDTQNRYPVDLGTAISKLFYKNLLKNGERCSKEQGYIALDTSAENAKVERPDGQNKSRINKKHAEIAVEIIENLLSNREPIITVSQIGIVTPYRLQVEEIVKLLEREGIKGIESGTVHKYQGREKDYIIYDTVEGFYNIPQLKPYIDFSFEKRLVNVALTRTVKLIFILCNKRSIVKILENCKNDSICKEFLTAFDFESSAKFREGLLKDISRP